MPARVGQPARPVAATPRAARPRPQPTPAVSTSTAGWQPRSVRRPAPAEPPPAPRNFPTSPDGTPLFKQSDADWGRRTLGKKSTVGSAGCAMTASAMAMSRIRGDVVTPRELDAWLDKHRGYAGDSLDWGRVGRMKNLRVETSPWSLDAVDRSLEAGRPVVIGVDYKRGSKGGGNGTDHWICLTSKSVGPDGAVTYSANDPGTGKVVTLTADRQGRLIGDAVGALGTYRSSGQLRLFVDEA